MPETSTPRGFRLASKSRPAGLALFAGTLLASGMVAAQPAPGICRAPANLPPCAAASATGSPAEPDLDTGLGNPVHLVTGAKHLQEIDLPAPLDGNHPSFIRFYPTTPGQGHATPPGWTHEYDARLESHGAGWRLALADGRVLSFDASGAAIAPGHGHIRILPATPGPETGHEPATHAWKQGNGEGLEFNAGGQLLAIHSPRRPPVRIERHATGPLAGRVHRIRGPRASLTLRYATSNGNPVLSELQTPAGTFKYTHDHPLAGDGTQPTTPPRLVRVTRPDGMSRHYHYEAARQGGHPGLITGITLANAQGRTWRARTWAYDTAGRVVRADPGDGGDLDRTLTFEYDQPGDTPATRVTRVRRTRVQADIAHGTRSGRIEHTLTRVAEPASADASMASSGPLALHEATVQRDRGGRLAALEGLRIQRHPGGQIRRLEAGDGWPGLALEFDTAGRRTAWHSTMTGTTSARFGAQGRVAQVGHANGDTLRITRDAAGRPVRLDHTGPDLPPVVVRLQWRGPHLARLSHPAEDEARRHDAQGRMTQHTVRRPHPAGPLSYQETFAYDAGGRLLRHGLPEGGALHYEWGAGPQLTALTWEARDGARHPVIRQLPGHAGYEYGNGLHLQPWQAADGRTHTLILSDGTHPLWGEQRQSDAHGRVVALRQAAAGTRPADTPGVIDRHYAYDGEGRMAGVQQQSGDPPDEPDGRRMQPFSTGCTTQTAGMPQAVTVPRADAGSPCRPIRPNTACKACRAGDRSNPRASAATPSTDWFAWAPGGALYARRSSTPGPIRRDASGLPQAVGQYRLQYSAQRLLAEVRHPGRDTIRYTHNAQGHAIRRTEGSNETERYYLDNRLVALWQRPHPAASPATHATAHAAKRSSAAQAPAAQPALPSTTQPAPPLPAPAFGITQRYLYAHDVPVGLLQTEPDGSVRLYYVHADALGAPVRVTDAARTVRWSATYDALGQARTQGTPALPLRAPGQDEDPATGWHGNIFRTYLPTHGQYLEPDPLGPVPGEQALGYAAQQPARYVDPLGLILLAFDGTRQGRANQSNVWKLAQVYQDGPSLYHAGPGNSVRLDWDAITAASSGQILRNQWQALLGALQSAQESTDPVPIDLLGFSRGAALARDFANRIARQTRDGWFSYDDPLRGTIGLCVDLRFLGLFDTVAQFGLLGISNAGYDLTIAGAWQWVAHAVALHEFRALFPLVAATGSTAHNVVEAPFIGAHSDIGGGMALDPHQQPLAAGDLSDVALNWMRWQALAAMVPMGALPTADQRATQALLHDERTPAERLLDGDRAVQDAALQSSTPQAADPAIGTAQRAALDTFIQRFSGWQVNAGNVVGSVDMHGYERWLQTERGMP